MAANRLHLIQFRKLEFKFIPSIAGILQYTLQLFSSIVVLNPLFELPSLPLVTVSFCL